MILLPLLSVRCFYADLTEFPTTYADVVNTMHGAEDYFTHLPVEVRAKFGHDFNKFLASLDNPQTLVDLGIVSSQSPVSPEQLPTEPSTPVQKPPEAQATSPAESEVK